MRNDELPAWFGFKYLEGEYSVEKLIECGKKRIDMLFRSKGNIDLANNFNDECVALGFMSLIITSVASNNAFFSNWLIETEGDVFGVLFKHESLASRVAILRFMLDKIVIGLEDISLLLDVDVDWLRSNLFSVLDIFKEHKRSRVQISDEIFVAIPFRSAYRILRYNRGIALRGYIITILPILFRLSKSLFQQFISKRLRVLKNKMDKPQFRDIATSIANEILEYWKSKKIVVSIKNSEASIDSRYKLWKRIELFPPCSRTLYNQFVATGYIPHGERLQLGLFLKALGMPVEEQLKFWYSAVDNVGLSWEEFLKKGGYYIRHIYGLEGSRKDYQAPKCDTIIAKYFCPFARMVFSELKTALKNIDKKLSEENIKMLREYVEVGDYKKACGLFLIFYAKHQFGANLDSNKVFEIKHPVQYVRILSRFARKKLKGKINKADENDKQG